MAFEPPTKKTKLDEHSGTNPAPSDKATSDNTTSDDSNPSDKATSDNTASGSNPAASDNTSFDSNDDNEIIAKQYDMYFILHLAHILKYPIIAFSDTKFNPGQKAVIQAGDNGCEITVYNANDPNTNGQVFGVLQLNATALKYGYECRNPFRMMFSLNGLAAFLSDVASREEFYIAISVEEGSNLLSFQWANSPNAGSGHGLPFKIELRDVTPEQKKFPDVAYWLEATISFEPLRETIREVMQLLQEGTPLTEEDFDTIKYQKKVRTKPYYYQQQPEEDVDKILLNWVHWESLERASAMATECLLYLVTSPPQRVMVRLLLAGLVEVVYLIQVDFLTETVDEQASFGHIRSLF